MGYGIYSVTKFVIPVYVFSHFWNPLPVSLPFVPKTGEQVFFLCVFRQQAVQKSLSLIGNGAGYKKYRTCRLLARGMAGGKLTHYKYKENRDLQGCWRGHEFLRGNGTEI